MSNILVEIVEAVKPIAGEVAAQLILALGIHYGYGPIGDIDLAQFDAIVFEREKHPTPPEGMGDVPALAYIPLSGFNTTNTTHVEWMKRIDAVNGWLLDEAGNKFEDPLGPNSFLVDLRKVEVQELYLELAKSHNDAGYQGLMLDAYDSVAHREFKNPGRFKGLSQAASEVIVSLAAQQRALGYRTIVNGGLFNGQGFDLLPIIAKDKSGIELMIESQFTDGAGQERDASVNAWSKARLNQYIRNSKAPKVHFIELKPLEGKTVNQTRNAMNAWVKSLVKGMHFTTYIEDGGNYVDGLVGQQ